MKQQILQAKLDRIEAMAREALRGPSAYRAETLVRIIKLIDDRAFSEQV